MISSRLLFFFCTIFIHLIVLSTSEPEVHSVICANKTNGNYTETSPYNTNLKKLLSSITNKTKNDYGFYNDSSGLDPDQVYGIALCRGDIKPADCLDCVKYAIVNLTSNCTNQKEAYIGLDFCMFRYSDENIFNNMKVLPYYFVSNPKIVSDVNGFNKSRQTLLDNLRDKAEAGGSRQKYADGQIPAPPPNNQTIYAIAQCTPDINEAECKRCLDNATARIPECCENLQGGRVIYPSCNFWYEISRFYTPSPPPPGNKSRTVIVVVVSVLVSVMLIICLYGLYNGSIGNRFRCGS